MSVTFLADRASIVGEMAVYLREQNRHRGLDLTNTQACIRSLVAAGFRGTVICAHMNDAINEARDALVAAEMARP